MNLPSIGYGIVIRLGVVGCGEIARAAHLPALAQLQAERLVHVTVFDADQARAVAAGEQFGIDAGDDWRNADLDAIAVCVPPGPNAEIAITALSMGLHVLCEKPPGRNLEHARRMADAAAQRPDVVTMVGFNRRFSPPVRWALDRSTAVAPATSYSGRFSRDALGTTPSNTASDWITSDSCHAIDLAVAVMGFPHAVSVARRVVGVGPDNVWTLQLHTEEGSALIHLNYAAGSRVETAEWIGPGYDVGLEIPDSARWVTEGFQPEHWSSRDQTPPMPWHEANGFVDEHRAFLGAIAGSAPRPETDFAYGAAFMQLVATILDAPSQSVQRLDRAPTANGAPASTPTASSRSGTGRPVVVLHHRLAAQPGFFAPDTLDLLGRHCEIRTLGDGDIAAGLEDATVLISGRGAPPLSPTILDQATHLELLVILGASVRHLEPEALMERGVTICNTADAVAGIVSEHCLMVSLAGLRQLTRQDRAMHNGEWGFGAQPTPRKRARRTALVARARALLRKVPVPLTLKQRVHRMVVRTPDRPPVATAKPRPTGTNAASELRGQVVGLLGWGHVARHFAQLLQPFECTVLVWSEAASADELAAAGARPASLSEILRSAKVVSLHRGLTDRTQGFLDAARLAEIRPGSVLVNTARGGLIDEQALVERLQHGDIVAALDVYDEEPLPPKHALRQLPNTILTPHNASTTAQENARMGAAAVRYALAWAEGEPVPGLDADRLDRMT